MISGAAQADIGVLVISAHKGEFETGYEKGGQTCEHVQLAKTMGLSKLFMVVNKMDDPTVNWSKERCPVSTYIWSSWLQIKIFLPIPGLLGSSIKRDWTRAYAPGGMALPL
ncbi:hypothetical protein SLEP1_g47613 [Rubroshorea leprosula]|uniref:Tr-type G domain-containing protein n=1 Tax=Rubroshorea leprosula TaxID=152421 RepID=A0AAV5LR74_9ROSI|nr:hypothetical protein SLEP1_g47613 [Rubroshorea leprosula]